MEFECHCVRLGLQVEIIRDAGATEPGLGVFCNASNKEIVLGFAALGPFNIKFVKSKFDLPGFCREYPLAILVVWIFAGISWRFQSINSVITIWVHFNIHWTVTSITWRSCCSCSSCSRCCCGGGG